MRLLPEQVPDEPRARAEAWLASASKPRSVAGAVIVVAIWLFVAWATYQGIARGPLD